MSGVNKVILIGRLGKDPEVRTIENGTMVANFSIATSETYKDRNSGDKKEITEWHNIVCWKGLAEIASKYLRKGDNVYIEGKLRTRSWEKDGVTRYTTEIVAESLNMLTPKNSGQNGQSGSSNGQAQGNGASTGRQSPPPVMEPAFDTGSGSDDLPF